MRYSPAAGITKLMSPMVRMGKKYGAEWWILVAGAIIILAIALMAIFAESIAPYSPHDQDTGPQLSPPGKTHLMGTDNLQRDVWSRMIHGSRTILRVAVLAALISSMIGITLGLISGFSGGYFDRVISLVMDSVYSFPGLILAIAFAAMLGPFSGWFAARHFR
jgi:peptide/nickel transport system permease protein